MHGIAEVEERTWLDSLTRTIQEKAGSQLDITETYKMMTEDVQR